ncbi:S-type pyocin domain-containing protein [Vibrio maritimus]|uniref:S-type pyocin domain-containing protein n=1 Tax=Vibrio maritimus TaxID=990268 RepID=UPI001F1692EC|nr:S-type pyocin domain-containing protein [Vibrio maritimus]
MLGNAITVGTRTSTGGKVLTGSAGVKINSLNVSVLGDEATCPCGADGCRGVGPIRQGSPRNIKIGDKLIAMKGDPVDTGCGNCFVLSSGDSVRLGTQTSGSITMGTGVYIGQGVDINLGSQAAAFHGTSPATSHPTNSLSSPLSWSSPEDNLPHISKVFAKSSLLPFGDISVGKSRETASSVGEVSVYAGSAEVATVGGLSTLALTKMTGIALADMAGFGLKVVGRAGILLALRPAQLGDGTLYGDEDIQTRKGVETLIRFGFDDEGRIHGYHVDATKIPKRSVHRVSDKFVVNLEPDVTLEWVPVAEEIAGTKILVNPIPGLDSHTIYIHPETEQGEEFDNTYITPISDVDLNDYILTFPSETGLPPLYIVYSKPPVKLLEVDYFGNFKGRPRNGTHADHMPSQRAATIWLKDKLGFIDDADIKKQMDLVASLIVPAKVHRKYSETYGWRNTAEQVAQDSRDLRAAVDNNINAIKPWLLEEGFSDSDLELAREKIHYLNESKGWYK